MERLEMWAAREAVRRVMKQAGKMLAHLDQIADNPEYDFDEADWELWNGFKREVTDSAEAMQMLADRQMTPRDPAGWALPGDAAHEEIPGRLEADGTPKSAPMYCSVAPECDLAEGHEGKCRELPV